MRFFLPALRRTDEGCASVRLNPGDAPASLLIAIIAPYSRKLWSAATFWVLSIGFWVLGFGCCELAT
jgi:hypothetical protein